MASCHLRHVAALLHHFGVLSVYNQKDIIPDGNNMGACDFYALGIARSHGYMTEPSPPLAAAPDSLVPRLTRMNLQVLSVTMLLTFALLATATWLVARDRQVQ